MMSRILVCWALVCLVLLSPGSARAREEKGRIIITAEEIAIMRAVKMADVLNQVPGLKAGDTSVSIHGSYKVKVLVDGRPINDPTSSHGGVRWDMVPLENVEKIEILRGKGGLEYGNDASGGVILVTTRKIRDFSGNIKVYGGNHKTGNTSGNCRISKGKMGISLSAAWYTTDGFQVNNDKKQKRAGGKIEFSPDRKKSFVFSADHLDEKKGMSGIPDYPTPYSRMDSFMDSFSFSARAGSVRANTYFNKGKKHHIDISRNLDNTLFVRQAGADICTSFSLEKWGNLDCGAMVQWGHARGTTLNDRKETGGSLFSSHSFEMESLPITFTAGLRGNIYSDFNNSINPEVKGSWQKNDLHVTLVYNRSCNTPSFYQRYNRTSTTLPNPDLGMETADNLSLSFSGKLMPFLSAGATLFYNRLADRITYVRNNDGTGQYQNLGEVSYKGFDLSLGWKPCEKITLKAAYTCLIALDETTDLWLTAKAKHKANAELIVSPVDKLSIVAGIDCTSRVYTRKDNSGTVPGYALFNLRGEYGFKRFSIFSEVKNLTDTKYYYVDGTMAPPLTWILGINRRF